MEDTLLGLKEGENGVYRCGECGELVVLEHGIEECDVNIGKLSGIKRYALRFLKANKDAFDQAVLNLRNRKH